MVLERAGLPSLIAENGAGSVTMQETQACPRLLSVQHKRHNSSCFLGIAGNKGCHHSVTTPLTRRARTGWMLAGTSRMGRQTPRGCPEQRSRKQSCPTVIPLHPWAIKAGRLSPESALPVRDPQNSKGGICGRPVVPSTAVSHTLCPTRWCTSSPSNQQQHRPLRPSNLPLCLL